MPSLIAFDLDDTLYSESEYVVSGLCAVAHRLASTYTEFNADTLFQIMHQAVGNPFDAVSEWLQHYNCDVDIPEMVKTYRYHTPQITLRDGVLETIHQLQQKGHIVAIITDGRTVTQTLKIRALGLDNIIPASLISISETIGADKLSPIPFHRLDKLQPDCDRRYYIGDNPAKDFLQPNSLGWDTLMLVDDGRNIHPQQLSSFPTAYHPQHTLSKITNILDFIF